MSARHADANPTSVAARSATAPRPMPFLLAAFAVASLFAATSSSPASAQSTRVTALPASEVFSLRVVGDTIAAGTDTSVFVSTNGGVTWRGSPRPAPAVNTIEAVLVRNHRLFAGTFGSGVFESDDLGASWRSARIGQCPIQLLRGFTQSDAVNVGCEADDVLAIKSFDQSGHRA